jgi:hypothetical protein
MALKAPMTDKATAICQALRVEATTSAEMPRPMKKITIIARRPHWSPRRPAGSEPSPNIRNAPAP